MKRDQLTSTQVIDLMKQKQGDKSGKDFAAELGISPSYLSDLYLGKREPGPSVLEALGLSRRVSFEKSPA